MKNFFALLLMLAALLLARASRAQVGIGTLIPDAKALLELKATDKGLLIPRLTAGQRTGIATPPQGLMVYQTDGTAGGGAQTGFWYYAGTGGWVFIDPAPIGDNLGNHTATQNLNLQSNLLVGGTAATPGTVGLSMLSTGDARLGKTTIWQSTADDRRLRFGDGSYATIGEVGGDDQVQLQGKTFAFLNANPGVAGYTGAVGIGLAAPGATLDVVRGDAPDATATFRGTERNSHFSYATDEDTYIRGGKATANVLLNDNGGRVGVGTAVPFSQLANTATNIVGTDGYGVAEKSLTWTSNLVGYTGAFYNANPGTGQNGLAVKVAGAAAATTALDVSQGTAATAGASLLLVRGDGHVGIGSNAPNATLEVRRGTATDGTAAFWGTSRTSHFNYATGEDTYIRGGKATANVLLNDNGGNVGIGTAGPNSRLAISPSTVEPKITLWDGGSTTDHYGFGVSGGQLNYQVPGTGDNHVFYQGGKNGTGTELVRITGGGTVGIGTVSPFTTSRLHAVSRNIYNGVFVNLPITALSQTQAVHAEVFTTQSISDATGVFGQAVSGANGEYGTGGNFNGGQYGVNALATASNGIGGRFEGQIGTFGVASTSTNTAAYAVAGNVSGSGNGLKVAVYGVAGSGASSYAGYFAGNVFVSGTLAKSGGTFRIDHPQDPENKYLVHSFVESPEMLNVYRGHVVTDAQGRATATLPAYFEAENAGFEYHLTAVGQFAQAIVAEEVHGNQFTIATDKPNVKVSWQVTGARQDKWAQTHPIDPEEPKTGAARGHYLLPELYGRPASEGIVPPPAPTTAAEIPVSRRTLSVAQ